MNSRFIFIVGLPRTGSKLVKQIVEQTPNHSVSICPESYFLGHRYKSGVLGKLQSLGNLDSDRTIKEFVNSIYSDEYSWSYWTQLNAGRFAICREEFESLLLDSDRTPRGIYIALMTAYGGSDTEILGDKTPGHLYHVKTLLEWFPTAKIIHTSRNPGAIVTSEIHKRRHRKNSLRKHAMLVNSAWAITASNMISLRKAARIHNTFTKSTCDNYYAIKLEELITDPELVTKKLCRFLEIDFHRSMLDIQQLDSSYNNEPKSGFNETALHLWKDELKPAQKRFLKFWAKPYFRAFNFES